ncbi:heme exporter protein CcmD [Achromobacter ruhlandii]|uniref:heme exporter protein CcmD n=1 Tax=Achromobacter ruhlandii TaxID=72557 RepID=UPI000AE523EE|nr:heme exporter protein CcmD [Achromobacter ruhlandii]
MMHWQSWAAFWHMGGRAAFVWGSYGMLALLVLAECVSLARRRRRALRRLAALASESPTARQQSHDGGPA